MSLTVVYFFGIVFTCCPLVAGICSNETCGVNASCKSASCLCEKHTLDWEIIIGNITFCLQTCNESDPTTHNLCPENTTCRLNRCNCTDGFFLSPRGECIFINDTEETTAVYEGVSDTEEMTTVYEVINDTEETATVYEADYDMDETSTNSNETTTIEVSKAETTGRTTTKVLTSGQKGHPKPVSVKLMAATIGGSLAFLVILVVGFCLLLHLRSNRRRKSLTSVEDGETSSESARSTGEIFPQNIDQVHYENLPMEGILNESDEKGVRDDCMMLQHLGEPTMDNTRYSSISMASDRDGALQYQNIQTTELHNNLQIKPALIEDVAHSSKHQSKIDIEDNLPCISGDTQHNLEEATDSLPPGSHELHSLGLTENSIYDGFSESQIQLEDNVIYQSANVSKPEGDLANAPTHGDKDKTNISVTSEETCQEELIASLVDNSVYDSTNLSNSRKGLVSHAHYDTTNQPQPSVRNHRENESEKKGSATNEGTYDVRNPQRVDTVESPAVNEYEEINDVVAGRYCFGQDDTFPLQQDDEDQESAEIYETCERRRIDSDEGISTEDSERRISVNDEELIASLEDNSFYESTDPSEDRNCLQGRTLSDAANQHKTRIANQQESLSQTDCPTIEETYDAEKPQQLSTVVSPTVDNYEDIEPMFEKRASFANNSTEGDDIYSLEKDTEDSESAKNDEIYDRRHIISDEKIGTESRNNGENLYNSLYDTFSAPHETGEDLVSLTSSNISNEHKNGHRLEELLPLDDSLGVSTWRGSEEAIATDSTDDNQDIMKPLEVEWKNPMTDNKIEANAEFGGNSSKVLDSMHTPKETFRNAVGEDADSEQSNSHNLDSCDPNGEDSEEETGDIEYNSLYDLWNVPSRENDETTTTQECDV